MQLFIDVVGTCNLKCPSCPVGNLPEIKNTKGIMKPDKLKAILLKAMSECTIDYVALYNWTDPLINPYLPELIRIVKEFDIPCYLSSNLNLLTNEDELMMANPDIFRVSMSGFSQENYGINHRGGEVSTVLENLQRLVAAKIRTNSKTRISILYHRYLGNLDDELKLHEWAKKLDIIFETNWAYLMPIEKILAFTYNESSFSPMNEEDKDVIKRLALPLDKAISTAQYYNNQPCKLLEDQIVMDVQGDVTLCCAIYNQARYKLGNFLERPLSEIIKDKYQLENCKNICNACTKKGIHIYVTYGCSEFQQIATQNVLQHYTHAFEIKSKSYDMLIRLLSRYAPSSLNLARRIKKRIKKKKNNNIT